MGHQELWATAALPVWMDFIRCVQCTFRRIIPASRCAYSPPDTRFATDGPQRLDALLEACPDLAPEPAIKQVSPVDAAFEPAPNQPNFGADRCLVDTGCRPPRLIPRI